MPIEESQSGNIQLLPDGKARILAGDIFEPVDATSKRYVSHFATCPQARNWRKRS